MDAGKREGDEDQTAEIRGSDGAATGLPPLRQTISPPTTTTDERMDKRGNEIKTFASDHLPLLGLPLEPAKRAASSVPSLSVHYRYGPIQIAKWGNRRRKG